jgi:LuxR family transcriptional regulator, maltose regulon positive regulatory protein
MPKPSLHVLAWSEEHQHYELHTHGCLQQCFRREDKQPWQDWLTEQRSFSFQGQHGHLSVIKEARPEERATGMPTARFTDRPTSAISDRRAV